VPGTRRATEASDGARAVEEAVAALSLQQHDGRLDGSVPANMWGPVVFGGFALAHAVAAATHDAPPGRRLQSLHAHFLRPVRGGAPISYRVSTLTEGRTLSVRRLDAEQADQHVLAMTCTLSADAESYEYQAEMPDGLPEPEALPARLIGPWLNAPLGPTEPRPDGTRRATHRMWFRTASALPDDSHLAAAFTAFATDFTYTGARPLHLEGDTRGVISLDHAAWFHRPPRPDAWMYYEVQSLVNTAGRGLLRGAMYARDGSLCVTVAQETILRRYEAAEPRSS